jgi:6-phosphofructokinase
VQAEIEQRTGYEARVTQLGYLLRGGTPSAYDRVIATRFGIEAIDAVNERDFGVMVALRGTDVIRVPLEAGVAKLKTVDQRLFDTAAVFFG